MIYVRLLFYNQKRNQKMYNHNKTGILKYNLYHLQILNQEVIFNVTQIMSHILHSQELASPIVEPQLFKIRIMFLKSIKSKLI